MLFHYPQNFILKLFEGQDCSTAPLSASLGILRLSVIPFSLLSPLRAFGARILSLVPNFYFPASFSHSFLRDSYTHLWHRQPRHNESGGRVVVVGPGPFFGPFYPYYGYYPYPPAALAGKFGEVEFKTHLKNAELHIDGGYAAQIKETKKFALRPGNHDIAWRDLEGQTL